MKCLIFGLRKISLTIECRKYNYDIALFFAQ